MHIHIRVSVCVCVSLSLSLIVSSCKARLEGWKTEPRGRSSERPPVDTINPARPQVALGKHYSIPCIHIYMYIYIYIYIFGWLSKLWSLVGSPEC